MIWSQLRVVGCYHAALLNVNYFAFQLFTIVDLFLLRPPADLLVEVLHGMRGKLRFLLQFGCMKLVV